MSTSKILTSTSEMLTSTSERRRILIQTACHTSGPYAVVCAFTSTSEPYVVVRVLCRRLSFMSTSKIATSTSEMLTSTSERRRILIQTACHTMGRIVFSTIDSTRSFAQCVFLVLVKTEYEYGLDHVGGRQAL